MSSLIRTRKQGVTTTVSIPVVDAEVVPFHPANYWQSTETPAMKLTTMGKSEVSEMLHTEAKKKARKAQAQAKDCNCGKAKAKA